MTVNLLQRLPENINKLSGKQLRELLPVEDIDRWIKNGWTMSLITKLVNMKTGLNLSVPEMKEVFKKASIKIP